MEGSENWRNFKCDSFTTKKGLVQMSTICLVRHGETDWNAIGKLQGRQNIPLNQTGKQQAKEAGLFLKETDWDVIISSPLKRAKETAEIINESLGLTSVIEMDDFIEKDYGEASGLTVEERKNLFPEGKYPGEEDWESLSNRTISGIEKIKLKYSGQKVLLVAHGAVINAILATLSKGEIGTGKTQLINACICNISFLEEEWKIQNYNQIEHLSYYSETAKISS
jgi:uncharacterized phosphatase